MPIEANASGGSSSSYQQDTFEAILDFGKGGQTDTATITFTGMTDTKIVQCFYTSNLTEVAILDMRVVESSRTDGVGFDIIGIAPSGAFGTYNVRCIVSGQ